MKLTEEQQYFVKDRSGHILVLASAGAGKTHALTYFIEDKIKYGIKPNQIISFSFTRKAANELKERVEKRIKKNNKQVKFNYISTIHSFCWNELIKPFYKELGYKKQPVVVNDFPEMIMEKLYEKYKKEFTGSKREQIISQIKNAIHQELQDKIESNLTIDLIKMLIENNMIMFDFMIHFSNYLLKEIPDKIRQKFGSIKYILQDECQDSNNVQYEFLKLLQKTFNDEITGEPYLVFVGDFKQSIYGFRGSNPYVIKKFFDEYKPKVHFLSYNFRSSPEIVEFANRFAENIDLGDEFLNQSRFQKHGGDIEEGEIYEIYDVDEFLEQLKMFDKPLHENCIIARTNRTLRVIAKTLQLLGIPYYLHTEYDILKRSEVKFLMHILNIVSNGYNKLAMLEIIKLAKKTIPKIIEEEIDECDSITDVYNKFVKIKHIKEIFEIYELAKTGDINKTFEIIGDIFENKNKRKETIISNLERFMNDLQMIKIENGLNDWMEALEIMLFESQFIDKKIEGKIQLITVHKAKGLQWDNVLFIYNLSILDSIEHKFFNIEEEKRVVYTAITRPKRTLILWSLEGDMEYKLFIQEKLFEMVNKSIKKGFINVEEFKKY